MPDAVYTSEGAALRRVETLRARGYWPGVIRRTDGLFMLTFDPDLAVTP